MRRLIDDYYHKNLANPPVAVIRTLIIDEAHFLRNAVSFWGIGAALAGNGAELCGNQPVCRVPDNSSLSHFSVLSRREDVVGPAGVGLAGPSLFRSQVSSRSTPQVPVALHELVGGAGAGARHAIEQASRRWRGGRRGDSGRTRRKLDFHTGRCVRRQRRRVRARSRRGNARGPRRRRRVARLHRGARRH